MAIVSESGLYSLILTSRRPEAKAFRRAYEATRDTDPFRRRMAAQTSYDP